eukprot:1183407-Prorocentrum_minimum.AAC.2
MATCAVRVYLWKGGSGNWKCSVVYSRRRGLCSPCCEAAYAAVTKSDIQCLTFFWHDIGGRF